MLKTVLLAFTLSAVVNGQDDGRYYPDNDGSYNGGGDGSYRPDGDGAYTGQNIPYDGGNGQYRDSAGRYRPDGSGSFNGDRGTGGGRYDGDRGQPGGSYSGQGGGGSGISSALPRPRPSVVVTRPSSNIGIPVGRPPGSSIGFESNRNRPTITPSPVTRPTTRPSGLGLGSSSGSGGRTSGLEDNYDGKWRIIKHEKERDEDGYHYIYETENKILAEEAGRIENRGTDEEGMKAGGFYEYTGPDNVVYRVDYTSDDRGFLPQGDHIPPIPDAIQKLLIWLEANPEKPTI